MHRSIQAECTFAQVKQDMNFKRFMCLGKRNIIIESILLTMAQNINKLHNKHPKAKLASIYFKLRKEAIANGFSTPLIRQPLF